ncbi:MAG: DUF4097 family beta strand repeat-containing protein [Mycobacterium leprae]
MTQEERKMILQMVADGKISPSEGAELLRAVEQPKAADADGDSAARRVNTFASGLSSFIEDVVSKVSSAINENVGPRYEFPSEVAGEFTATEVPIHIETVNGRVEVHTWDHPGYRANIVVKARGANEEEARNRARGAFNVQADENGFHLESREGEFSDLGVNVTLMVPKEKTYRLEARSSNGAIEVTDLVAGGGRLETGNGRLTCRGGKFDRLELRSGNGSMEIESDVRDLAANSGNGSIHVRPTGSDRQNLRLTTGNGSAHVECSRLPSGTAFAIDAHTGMGSVNLSLPNLEMDRDVRSMGHKEVKARSQNFDQAATQVMITARTGLGSINID